MTWPTGEYAFVECVKINNNGGLMSGGIMSGGIMSGGLMSGGLMSGGLMSVHRSMGNLSRLGKL